MFIIIIPNTAVESTKIPIRRTAVTPNTTTTPNRTIGRTPPGAQPPLQTQRPGHGHEFSFHYG